MRPDENEIKRALVDSTLSLIVLATMLKNAGLDNHEIATGHVEKNRNILNRMGVFFTPVEQQEYLDKLNDFRNQKGCEKS